MTRAQPKKSNNGGNMASLQLNHIYKVYPNGVKAVNDFCMDIADKEFIVFVGPSGCGKSTTLRMIAGLEDITAGELRIGDVVVNDMEPKDRDIAMVFQNYALYPHMTVYDNMAFGLRLRKVPKEEIDRKVKEAARILGITDYLDRKPKAMSGGQRQRVALGRAIVREPKVFLLDEPLSNLDAKLRTAMRSEISKLHHKLQTTFIYVTHDQVEAMTMGTRIVVMKDGFVQQIDTPRNLYRFPGNKFVAGFIGTPQMNFFDGKLLLHDGVVRVTFDNTDVSLDVPATYFHKADRSYLNGDKPVTIGLRAEHISVDPNRYPFKAKCRVSHTEELGTDCQVYADFNIQSEETVAESPTRVIVKAPAGSYYDVDEIIEVSLDMSHLHVFDAETENTIAPRIPKEVVVEGVVTKNSLSVLGEKIALPEAIHVEDGKYSVVIPTTAVTLGGKITANVVEEEDVNKQRLVHLQLGDTILFAIVDNDATVGEKVKIDIDLKQITLKRGEEVVVAPLECTNSLAGKVSKHKCVVEKEIKGKMKKINDLAFTLDVADAKFECPRNLAMRLVNGGGQDIFNKQLELQFDAYSTEVVDAGDSVVGITAQVESVLDYGAEKFLRCKVGESTVNIVVGVQLSEKIAAEGVPSAVKLVLDVDSLAIIEVDRGIRLA